MVFRYSGQDNGENLLFSDSIRLPHLRANTAIQGVAYEPSPFTVVNLEVPFPIFLRVSVREIRLAVDIQVGRHPVSNVSNERLSAGYGKLPDSHTKKHPRAVLFITLYCTASVQGEQKVCLDNFERLVAMLRNTERELLNDISELNVQVRLFGIELCSDSADWKWG